MTIIDKTQDELLTIIFDLINDEVFLNTDASEHKGIVEYAITSRLNQNFHQAEETKQNEWLQSFRAELDNCFLCPPLHEVPIVVGFVSSCYTAFGSAGVLS